MTVSDQVPTPSDALGRPCPPDRVPCPVSKGHGRGRGRGTHSTENQPTVTVSRRRPTNTTAPSFTREAIVRFAERIGDWRRLITELDDPTDDR